MRALLPFIVTDDEITYYIYVRPAGENDRFSSSYRNVGNCRPSKGERVEIFQIITKVVE